MFDYNIDGVAFRLKEQRDLTLLSKYGKVFCVFDENDSGNISFGMQKDGSKYFVKVAGLQTTNSNQKPSEAVSALRCAITAYEELKHPALIELIEHRYEGDVYVAAFKWAEGECLFDHWNFMWRPKTHSQSPYNRFKRLPIQKRLAAFGTICSFFHLVARAGYSAIDFYDGSVIYNFGNDVVTICDIDYFTRAPYVNKMGRMWGSSRFMSPEENELNAVIDEITNVFTLGAAAFLCFGDEKERSFEKWNAGKGLYDVAAKATSADRAERYQTIEEFCGEWERAKVKTL